MTNRDYDPIKEANERLRGALAQLKYARQVQKVFMYLGKGLSIETSRQRILVMIVEALQALFSQAHYLVQLTDPKTCEPTLVDYRGPLIAGVASTIHLTASAVEKTRLNSSTVQAANVEISEYPPRLFDNSIHTLLVPLVADEQLFGAIHLESDERFPLDADDEMLLISLANQLAMGLRNQRLLEETAFLKDYLSDILEQANALIIVTDINRQILVFNKAAEHLLGFPKDQTIGTDLFIWVPGEEHSRFAEKISSTFSGGLSATGVETRMRNRDGELVQIIFHLSALRDRNGEIDSLILVGQDMTQVRQLEAQIIEAEKMASLGKLAAGVVHELNNPLTSISVYAEYLLKKMRAGDLVENDVAKLERIRAGAGRIQKLTRDLVSYGRPSSEEPEMLQFNEIVLQGLSFCEHTVRKYDVVVHRNLAEEIPEFLGNRTQLLQMIINLITNSCHAMQGGGELMLKVQRINPKIVELVVGDTGTGISSKDFSRVFEPFFTTKSPGEGTGLGLSIVSRIVEHHGGEIEVSSTLGVGTSMRIKLPLDNPVFGVKPEKDSVVSDPKPPLHE
jgi:PAS domain S-box-containing protein